VSVLAIGVERSARAARLRAVGVVLVAAVLFGMMAVLVRVACREMASGQVACLRFAGSLLVLLALSRGRGLRPSPGKLPRVLIRGLLGAVSIVLYYHAIAEAGAGVATLLYSIYPVWTALIARPLVGERVDGNLGAALALSVAGLVAVLGPGVEARHAALPGAAAAIAASVFAGGAVAAARQLRLTETTLVVTTHFMAVGTVVTAPAFLAGLAPLSPATLAALAGIVLTSLGGQLLLHEGLGFLPAAQGSLTVATSVAVASGLQAAWLGEHLGRESLLGALLIVAAVGVAARPTGAPSPGRA
jgi:drug/metabolite transporter (DMT)-like permease